MDAVLAKEVHGRERAESEVTIGLAGAGQMGTDIVVQAALMPGVRIGAISEVRGSPATGDEVDVVDHRDRYVGRGVWHATAPVRVRIYAAQREPLEEASAGDIVAAIGIKEMSTGDSLCEKGHRVVFEAMEFE